MMLTSLRRLVALAAPIALGAWFGGVTAQTPRPVTLLSEVRAAIAAHDLSRADALVAMQRREKGATPEVLEALSWLARGAQSEGQRDRADAYASEAQRLAQRPEVSMSYPVMRRQLGKHSAYAAKPNDPYFFDQWNLENRAANSAPVGLSLAQSIRRFRLRNGSGASGCRSLLRRASVRNSQTARRRN